MSQQIPRGRPSHVGDHSGSDGQESIDETLNAILDAEADEITCAANYERSGDRKAYRAGHCGRT